MQDRKFTFKAVLAAALAASLLTTALPVLAASVGDAFELGSVNIINQKTVLRGNAGKTLQLRNTGAGFPLQLNAPDGKAPLKVNNSELVKKLNVDLLDGKHASAFLGSSDLVAAFAGGDQFEQVDETAVVVRSVTLAAPSDGLVIVNSTASVEEGNLGDDVWCSITTGTVIDSDHLQWWTSPGVAFGHSQLAGTRGFDVGAGEFTVNLVCHRDGTFNSNIWDSELTAIFIPT